MTSEKIDVVYTGADVDRTTTTVDEPHKLNDTVEVDGQTYTVIRIETRPTPDGVKQRVILA